MRNSVVVAIIGLCLPACQPMSQGAEIQTVSAVHAPRGIAQTGADLSEALCSGCHAVNFGGVSPNPQAPPFAMIANTKELTLDTLGTWMHDSHNFPEMMNFEVADEDVDHLAAYIITLRKEGYKPPIQ